MSRVLIVAATLVVATSHARADDVRSALRMRAAAIDEGEHDDVLRAERDDGISGTRRAGAIGAAIFPGVLVHGAGSWVVHEKRAAKRLAVVGWIGLGTLGISGAAVGISGANPWITLAGVPLIIAGSGLAFPTWFADIWVASGGRRIRSAPHVDAPWSVELGTTYLHDAYRERGFARAAARYAIDRYTIGASALFDVEGVSRTGDLEGRVRILGHAATGETVADASTLWVRVAARRHADDDDRVAITTAEAEVGARVDMQRVDPILLGNFAEISVGMGVERVRYADTASDTDSLYLGRFAWGLYVGHRSELAVYYNHRRDSLAGGIAASRAAGFVGSVGATLDLRLGGPLSFVGDLEIGNGWVTSLGVRYHGGTR